MQYNNLPLEAVPAAIAERLIELVSQHDKVAWFVSGGSNISIECATLGILQDLNLDLSKLTILLNDERFGLVGHQDSNWFQLEQAGFMVNGPNYIAPFTEHETTLLQAVVRYEELVTEILAQHYGFSQLGMGDDGHTSGILSHSPAVEVSDDFVCGYEAPPYARMTTTLNALRHFDEVSLIAYGESKWPQLEQLQTSVDVSKQPVQVIADIPLVTIYTDYKVQQESEEV